MGLISCSNIIYYLFWKSLIGLTGLRNLGNTCYMNAAIQALSNCHPFSDFFRSVDSIAPFASKILDNGEPPVSHSFRCLLQALWSEERIRCVNPQHFLAVCFFSQKFL